MFCYVTKSYEISQNQHEFTVNYFSTIRNWRFNIILGLWTNHVDKLGVAQMSNLFNKSYLVKVSTKGEGVKMPQILSTCFVHTPLQNLVLLSADLEFLKTDR